MGSTDLSGVHFIVFFNCAEERDVHQGTGVNRCVCVRAFVCVQSSTLNCGHVAHSFRSRATRVLVPGSFLNYGPIGTMVNSCLCGSTPSSGAQFRRCLFTRVNSVSSG